MFCSRGCFLVHNPTRARASSCRVPSLVRTQGVVTGLKHFSLLEISTGIETVSALGKRVFCRHWVGVSLFSDASNAATLRSAGVAASM